MSKRIFITGFGVITSVGKNASENFDSLVHERSGFGALEILKTAHHHTLPACEIKLQDNELYALAGIKSGLGFTRATTLGLLAAKEAIQSAGLTDHEIQNSGLISATSAGGIRELERYYLQLKDLNQQGSFEEFVDTGNPGEHTERMAEYLNIKRYIGTISTACSSSANAIMLGAQLIKNKIVDRVICGGAEALSKFTINGFNALMILDTQHCRPFDATRKGLNLGEGAAYVVLESEEITVRAGRKPFAELLGYANANDAFHQTASSPDGMGAYQAMYGAIKSGGINPDQIDYINAHGTATENNDLSEGLAMQKLFDGKVPTFSSTKSYTGHTLAAAGSVEAAFCLMSMKHGFIFPNLNFKTPMKELSIQPEVTLQKGKNLKYVLSNSFGFGGNTSSLLFGAV